jgi:hypothetical protein
MHHPGYSSGFSWSPTEAQVSVPAPYTDYPRASYLVWMSGLDFCFTPPVEGLVHGSEASSVVWEETPESHQGCALPGSRDPCRLQSQGAGTHYSMGLGGLISLWPPKMLQEECRTSENKTQT